MLNLIEIDIINMRKRIRHGVHRVRRRVSTISDKFDRRDIAQMLTSVFVITQVFTVCSIGISFDQSIWLFGLSLITCGIIIWIVARGDFLKHYMAGIIIVSLFSLIVGYMLKASLNRILIAFSVGLPVATTVNLLKK